MGQLEDARKDEIYDGYSNKYKEINMFYVAISIVNLYLYTKAVEQEIATFEDFIDKYDYTDTIKKLSCINLNIKEIIKNLNI